MNGDSKHFVISRRVLFSTFAKHGIPALAFRGQSPRTCIWGIPKRSGVEAISLFNYCYNPSRVLRKSEIAHLHSLALAPRASVRQVQVSSLRSSHRGEHPVSTTMTDDWQ
jgi:hypothetical protein